MLPLLFFLSLLPACSSSAFFLSPLPSSSISCLSLFPCLCPLPCPFQKIHLRPVLFLLYRGEAFGDCSFHSAEGEGPCWCVLWPVLSIKSAGAAYLELSCGPGGSQLHGPRLEATSGPTEQLPCSVLFVFFYSENIKKKKNTQKNPGRDKE